MIVGSWDSWWGPSAEEVKKYHEIIVFTKQRGFSVWGYATRHEEPRKKWEVIGRFDGHYLQLYYCPSALSEDIDYQDYGCYFLIRKGDGSMLGFSAGFGADEETNSDSMRVVHCLMKRKTH